MTASNFQRFGSLSKSEFLQTHPLRTLASLRGDRPNPGSQSSKLTKHTQALRHLRQTYLLERRCFL